MANNRNTLYQSPISDNKSLVSSNRPSNRPSNKPSNSVDSRGNAISIIKKPFDPLKGEIIELQKRHYDQASTSELLDRGFSEIAKTKDKLTTNNFFNLYQELFYDLPKQGKESHTYLIEESTRYIGGYEDPKDDKIDNLLDRLTEIETSQIQTPSEHPLFRNGTAVRSNTGLGIMQEGHLRRVSNQGTGNDPSPYSQLKKTLGLKDAEGKPLKDEDSWTRVTEQTWQSLPKWPAGSNIDESADWSLTLSQFNVAVSNITVLKENVKSSELDQAEINFLIKELENKTPFLGNTLEDNFNGTIEYGPADLLPFTKPGDSQGDKDVYYTGGEYGDARPLYPLAVMNSIIEKYEAKDDKGIYGLGNNKYPNINERGHISEGEKRKETARRNQNRLTSTFNSINNSFNPIINPIISTYSSVASTLGFGFVSDYLDNYIERNAYLGPQSTEYGNDWRSYVIEELEDLLEEINQDLFERYEWTIDPERSFNQTTIDGITLNSGQFYWVEDSRSYNIWAASKVKQAIKDHKLEYGNSNKLSTLEDIRKGY